MTTKIDSSLDKESGPGSKLSEQEARCLVEEIKSHLDSARVLLLRLYEGTGWLVLGYDSWRQCVLSEFGRSESQLYRELSAARIEAMTSLPIGSFPESHVRAVREIFGNEEEAAFFLDLYWPGEATTAREVKSSAAIYWVTENVWGSKIHERMMSGEIGSVTAYRLGSVYIEVDGQMKKVVDSCSDPEVARRLAVINDHRPDLMAEIIASASIPLYESVPLSQASSRDLDAWLGIDNAERRAMHVENNLDYYRKREELTNKALSIASELAEIAQAFKELKEVAKRLGEALDELFEIKEMRDDNYR